jgi:hypothetical protein
MKRDMKDIVSQNVGLNLFVMYVKARFQIKFEQTKSYMVPIFYLIISSCSMFDLIQLLNLI